MSTSLPARRERLPPPLSDLPPTAPRGWSRSSGLLRLAGAWAGLLFYLGGLAVAALLDEPWRSVGIVTATLLFAPVASLVQRWFRPDPEGDAESDSDADWDEAAWATALPGQGGDGADADRDRGERSLI